MQNWVRFIICTAERRNPHGQYIVAVIVIPVIVIPVIVIPVITVIITVVVVMDIQGGTPNVVP